MIADHTSLWDETMPLLKLRGEGSRAFLNGQTTADFLRVKNGSFTRACWLNTAGKVKALLEARLTAQGAELVVLGGQVDGLIRAFEKVIFPCDLVTIDPLQSIRRVQKVAEKQTIRFQNVAWLSSDQQLPNEFQECQPLALTKLHRWRMIYGLLLGKDELNGDYNPFELGLSDLVSLEKGCYLGQETVAKLARVGQVRKQVRFWESDACLRVGQKLIKSLPYSVSNKIVGVITSSINDVEKGVSFGLAIVRSSAFSEQELTVTDGIVRLHLQVPYGFDSISDCD